MEVNKSGIIDRNILYNNLNEGVIKERYSAFVFNLNKSLTLIKKYSGLKRIIPDFKDKNVIIVGAGPSLEKNFDLLKRFQYRSEIVIFSTDMALKPLIKHGIFPKYVISCETSPVDFFGDIQTENMHLVAFSCMSNVNLKKWSGDISFYNWMLDRAEYNALWERAGIELGFVATGNIVTTQAVSIAMGCNIRALVLVGNDLGFKDRFYAKESIPHRNNLLINNRYKAYQTLEMDLLQKKREYEIRRGNKTFYTNSQFLAAKMWLEDLFSRQRIPVFDCSEPGCSEKYVEKVQLKDFFSTFQRKSKRKRR